MQKHWLRYLVSMTLCLLLGACGQSKKQPRDKAELSVPIEAPLDGSGPRVDAKDPALQLTSLINRVDLLRLLGNVFRVRLLDLQDSLFNLKVGVDRFCSSYEIEDQRHAQELWSEATMIWEELELLKIGPLQETSAMPSAQFFNWPAPLATCAIDAQVIDASQPGFKLSAEPDSKGLRALEYLLFEEELNLSCKLQGPRLQAWKSMSSRKKKQARCQYVQAVMADLQLQTEKIIAAWGPEDQHLFTQHGGDSARIKQMTQTLFDNLFYIETKLRRLKLAAPAGLEKQWCPRAPEPCPELEELIYSQRSREAMEANVDAFVTLMLGRIEGERYTGGFAALLRAEGGGASSDQIEERVLSLQKLVSGTPLSLRELIADHYGIGCELQGFSSWVCQMDAQLKELSRFLQQEFTSVLLLQSPELLEENPT